MSNLRPHHRHLDGKRLLEGRPMSDEQDEPVEAVIEQYTALRREQQRFEVRRRSKLLQAELEKSLPAGVPLHQRGFGVMDEDRPS